MNNAVAASLAKKIERRRAVLGVIGLGYVGLPLAIEFAKAGFPVIGFDLDPIKVKKVNAGVGYIKHIPSSAVQEIARRRDCYATNQFQNLRKADAIIICVPTPLTKQREPDMTYIVNTAETIGRYLRRGQLVILESTTYPGTTREVVLPRLQRTGLRAGSDFFLAFSPEREDPGNAKYSTHSIPKVVGGLTPRCLRLARQLYDSIVVKTVCVSSPEAAEATKLLENIFRCVNIALVNELKQVFEKMGVNIWEVIEAAKTKPFGFMPFYPGPGLGGHCIPIDPFYLTWKAREYEMPTRFIELAGEINTAMPDYVVQRLAASLNAEGKSVKGSHILLLGVAYKKDVDDLRESPSLRLIEILQEQGAKVSYHDPFIPVLPPTRRYQYNLRSVPLTAQRLRASDAVLIATDHTAVDYALVGRTARLVVDTRNAMARVPCVCQVVRA